MAAANVVTLEPHLLEHLLFQLTQILKNALTALAGCLEVLRYERTFPLG